MLFNLEASAAGINTLMVFIKVAQEWWADESANIEDDGDRGWVGFQAIVSEVSWHPEKEAIEYGFEEAKGKQVKFVF